MKRSTDTYLSWCETALACIVGAVLGLVIVLGLWSCVFLAVKYGVCVVFKLPVPPFWPFVLTACCVSWIVRLFRK